MSQASTKGYLPLPVTEKSEGSEDGELIQPSPRSTRNLKLIAISSVCVFSVIINILLLTRLSAALKSPRYELSRHAGLPADEYIVYNAINEFSVGNDTDMDRAWASLSTDPVSIVLTDDYAEEYNLVKGERFPWDFKNKGLYAVWGFHDLHCLKVIRNDIVQFRRGIPNSLGAGHINHCLDVLRQSIMCTANDQPMHAVLPDAGDLLGHGQVMQCRSWDKLAQWATAPDRASCYKSLDEYHDVTYGLELYAFCPEDSPYYERMTAYFEKYGHHDPYEPIPDAEGWEKKKP